ncbi:hypothetical protein IW261DRAFT_1426866 [Armillaria novae-zelandiae]|uniref:Uncharacterized protein n=1 Tax=Armillaria novae-zelandiae TaxID=153914 RepID=A0AA39NJB8_9AGAR|nr:hypothetical protein IW261DRAFT_1426866 [Armillaria novae-zelandiae]
MTEPNQNTGFTAATGFGCDELEYLAKNTVYFHFLKTGDFAALSDVWFEAIWEQHVLYWPPQDRSDNGLMDHRQHVRYALQWLFDTLDPDARNQAIAAVEPKVHPPGPPDFRRSTCQPTKTHLPQIDLFKRPTAEEIAKSKAVEACKCAVRAHLCRWKDSEECRTRRLARSTHIRTCYRLHWQT